MHINEDGSKTMGDRDQKIIHRWNHESQKSTTPRYRNLATPHLTFNC
jgi:hypothetical protein